jgi:riboflavin synthase
LFTGIVEEVGNIIDTPPHRLIIGADLTLSGVKLGDSVNVNGTCLTVVGFTGESVAVDVVEETLNRTALGTLRPGDPVNLERALTPESRMGGHIVQGHVDGVGTISDLSGSPDRRAMTIESPKEVAHYIVEKGFIAVDGISLTVAGIADVSFSIAVIPYTWEHTVLGTKSVGDQVNLEVDVLAKYVERLLPQR